MVRVLIVSLFEVFHGRALISCLKMKHKTHLYFPLDLCIECIPLPLPDSQRDFSFLLHRMLISDWKQGEMNLKPSWPAWFFIIVSLFSAVQVGCKSLVILGGKQPQAGRADKNCCLNITHILFLAVKHLHPALTEGSGSEKWPTHENKYVSLYVSIYVCMYIYIHTCMCIYTYIFAKILFCDKYFILEWKVLVKAFT